MRKDECASISPLKIICISLIFVLCSGIGVMAVNSQVSNVTIKFANNYELNVLTTKTKISEILKDNHIIVLEDEIVEPSLEENLDEEKLIRITKKHDDTEYVADLEETPIAGATDILNNYSTIVEKIETLEVEIPYETITKSASNSESDSNTKILQEGENGLKQVTYKITYRNDIEIDRVELESTIIKEPVDKIVQVNKVIVSRSSTSRTTKTNPAQTSSTSLAKKVEGIQPIVKTLNTSAYTASTCGKSSSSKGYGITSSGAKAQAWYTVAAGKGYPIGTVIYIPYFKNEANGGWFVVQDRGGAISNNKLDVYMNTYNECIKFGRRNLECYIYLL